MTPRSRRRCCSRAGGVDGLLLENAGDIPLPEAGPDRLRDRRYDVGDRRAHRAASRLPLGFNIVANAARASLACAVPPARSSSASTSGPNAYVANEGIVEGAAAEALRYRQLLDAEDIVVLADVPAEAWQPRHRRRSRGGPGARRRVLRRRGADRHRQPHRRRDADRARSRTSASAGSALPDDRRQGLPNSQRRRGDGVADGAGRGFLVQGQGRMHGGKVDRSKVESLMEKVTALRRAALFGGLAVPAGGDSGYSASDPEQFDILAAGGHQGDHLERVVDIAKKMTWPRKAKLRMSAAVRASRGCWPGNPEVLTGTKLGCRIAGRSRATCCAAGEGAAAYWR